MKAKTPPQGTISPKAFCNLMCASGIKRNDLAKKLGVAISTVASYRNGSLHVPPDVAEKMRQWARENRRKKYRGKKQMEDFCNAQIKGYIRHIMNDLYPQFTDSKTSGQPAIEHPLEW